MSVWDDIVGQSAAVQVLDRAVRDPDAMTHAWRGTGPPGSGRSTAARAFAAALQCPDHGCGTCQECRTALDGTHADVTVVTTDRLHITIDTVRELIPEAARRPSVGHWRVIVVEDADRMVERAADVLLKSLEEPTRHTVWILCAPSPEDVLVTSRARTRGSRRRTPAAADVAELLQRRDGIDLQIALYAARAAQSHIGLARRLAQDDTAKSRRHDVVTMTARIHTVGEAVNAAAAIAAIADEEETDVGAQREADERRQLLETLGADPGARTQPPHIRSQLNQLAKEQKTRKTRRLRDTVDRALIDLLSVYRDALILGSGAPVELINADARGVVEQIRSSMTPEQLLHAMDAIGTARERIEGNVPPLLALEAMAISLRLPT